MPINRKTMFLRRTVGCCLLATSLFGLTGCSIFERDSYQDNYSVITVDNIDELKENAYYVQHGDIYYQLYVGNTSFSKEAASYVDPSRVAWFGQDFDKIPTMYKGDKIVYHSSSPFTEEFIVERFEDMEYTVGICNLKKLDSGRYYFSTSPEDFMVNIRSDAGRLCNEGEATAVIDRIGGADLRAGNISRGGTITGLEKGKTYKSDIYIGTNLHEYKLVADVRAMVSMEAITLKDYYYTQSKTVTVSFPEYFNSGYYYINGYGFVRYIANGTKFTEDLDMNIPNVYPDGDEENPEYSVEVPEYTTDIKEDEFSILEDSTVTVTVNYEILSDTTDYDTPVAKVIGEYNVFTLTPETDGTLKGTFQLDAGTYTIQITGLSGRSYSYKATVPTKNNKTQETEAQTESGPSVKDNTEGTADNKTETSGTSIADQLKAAERNQQEGE